jgi:ppGpp synthetase/RelA/SpoT-type nucleotidyltranferase
MNEKSSDGLLQGYARLQESLVDFLTLTETTLKDFFEKSGNRLQSIQNRNRQTKSIESLAKKLETIRVSRLEDIHDLVALRFLFYLENELTRGLNDLHWNLKELGFEKVDYYERRSDDGFNAHFLILRLDRKHGHYERFKDFKIEVQFTTVLEHTWNEIQHQTIYKQEAELSAYDLESFSHLKKKFGEVMRDHLKKALKTLEYLDSSAKKLIKARQIFQEDNLREIDAATDLNQLYFSIDALHDALTENGLKVPPGYDLLGLMERTIKRSPELMVQPFLVSGSELEGKESTDVIKKCLEIVKYCRYIDPIRLFTFLGELWDKNSPFNNAVKEVLDSLCRYDVNALRQVGYAIQFHVVNHIATLPTDELLIKSDFYFEVFETLLELRLEGVDRTGIRTYSMPISAPLPNDTLLQVRTKVAERIMQMFERSADKHIRLRAIRTLGRLKDLPFTPDGDRESHRKMINDGARQIFDFYSSVYQTTELVIQKEIYKDFAEYGRQGEGLLTEADSTLLCSIASNQEFKVFCAFVGGIGDYFREGMNWRDAEERRSTELDDLVTEFEDPNAQVWQTRVNAVIHASEVLSVGECQGFLDFLRRLAVAKPKLIALFSDETVRRLGRFNYELLIGLSNGGHSVELSEFTDRLFCLNVALDSVATAMGYSECLFQYAYSRLLALPEEVFTDEVAQSVVRGLATRKKWDAATVSQCMLLLKRLAKAFPRFSWIRVLGWNEEAFAKEVTEAQCVELLDLLVNVPKIDHDEKEILSIFIDRFPERLIPFFEKRVLNPRDEVQGHYYALPSGNGSELRQAVTQRTDVILPALLSWFGAKNHKLRFSAPYLFDDLFSLSDDEVMKAMSGFVEKGGKELEIVISLLQSSSGKIGSAEICKQIIDRHHKNDAVVRTVMNHLMHVDTYWGDDGGLQQMIGFRDSVLAWNSEGNIRLERFKEKFKRFADQMIASEKARIDKERTFEELEYDDYLSSSKKVGNESDD